MDPVGERERQRHPTRRPAPCSSREIVAPRRCAFRPATRNVVEAMISRFQLPSPAPCTVRQQRHEPPRPLRCPRCWWSHHGHLPACDLDAPTIPERICGDDPHRQARVARIGSDDDIVASRTARTAAIQTGRSGSALRWALSRASHEPSRVSCVSYGDHRPIRGAHLIEDAQHASDDVLGPSPFDPFQLRRGLTTPDLHRVASVVSGGGARAARHQPPHRSGRGARA